MSSLKSNSTSNVGCLFPPSTAIIDYIIFPLEFDGFAMFYDVYPHVFPNPLKCLVNLVVSRETLRFFSMVLRYSSRMICLSASISSRATRFSFIFASMLPTEYMMVEWSLLNFFPMSP